MTIEETFQGLVFAGCCDGAPGHGPDRENRAEKARAAMQATVEATWQAAHNEFGYVSEEEFSVALTEVQRRIAALGKSEEE